MHPRSKLPRYLSQKELRLLLKYSALHLNQRDFLIIMLLASTGLRPNEIVLLKRSDVHLDQRRLDLHVKGGWCKKTPLCKSMTNLLADYLSTRDDIDSAVFVNNKSRPVTVSWIQRLVKCTGKEADLPVSLTCNHLRHTYATYAADRHGKIITKALMGHQRLTTTEIYTHLSPSYFRPLAQGHPFQGVTGGESHE
jgi:integrase/recombinase XerD